MRLLVPILGCILFGGMMTFASLVIFWLFTDEDDADVDAR